jgi:hypothetical protein
LYSTASTSSANCKLACHLFAVLHRHELLCTCRRGSRPAPGQIDRDAQQATGRSLDLDQVITQTGYGGFNDLLQCHPFGILKLRRAMNQNRSTKKNGR